ncbi:hypothetical protein V5799_024246, partial [Amblyomma americanum]
YISDEHEPERNFSSSDPEFSERALRNSGGAPMQGTIETGVVVSHELVSSFPNDTAHEPLLDHLRLLFAGKLAYVALSCATDVNGLNLTNADNDFTLYYGRANPDRN